MKLFLKQDRNEGDAFPRNVFLSWGYQHCSVMTEKVVDEEFQMVEQHKSWQRNGFYFKIELPFTVTGDYICPDTYRFRTGKCRPTIVIARRKSLVGQHTGKTMLWRSAGLIPQDFANDPFNDKRNNQLFGNEQKSIEEAA